MINYSAPVKLAFLGRNHAAVVGANHTLATALKAAHRLPAKQRANAIIHFDETAGLPARSPLRLFDVEEFCRLNGSP